MRSTINKDLGFSNEDRIENIRRGSMVSMIKTASRNLMSTVIRSPTEGLVNVMESVLRAGAGGNIGEAVKTAMPFGGKNTWTDSFKHVEYMFKGAETRDTVDYILKRPELMGEWTGMFDTINEIRRKTNGTGKVLPILEKGVDTLNVFNRWQDHMTRRSIFLSKLRQLTKEQYGIDEVMKYCLSQMNEKVKFACCLYACSPLLNYKDIKNGFLKLKSNKFNIHFNRIQIDTLL